MSRAAVDVQIPSSTILSILKKAILQVSVQNKKSTSVAKTKIMLDKLSFLNCAWNACRLILISHIGCFSEEYFFQVPRFTNTENSCIWRTEGQRDSTEGFKRVKVTVWCAMLTNGVVGPYSFNIEPADELIFIIFFTGTWGLGSTIPKNSVFPRDRAPYHIRCAVCFLLGVMDPNHGSEIYGSTGWHQDHPS